MIMCILQRPLDYLMKLIPDNMSTEVKVHVSYYVQSRETESTD